VIDRIGHHHPRPDQRWRHAGARVGQHVDGRCIDDRRRASNGGLDTRNNPDTVGFQRGCEKSTARDRFGTRLRSSPVKNVISAGGELR
jgi:hypothetical protein